MKIYDYKYLTFSISKFLEFDVSRYKFIVNFVVELNLTYKSISRFLVQNSELGLYVSNSSTLNHSVWIPVAQKLDQPLVRSTYKWSYATVFGNLCQNNITPYHITVYFDTNRNIFLCAFYSKQPKITPVDIVYSISKI